MRLTTFYLRTRVIVAVYLLTFIRSTHCDIRELYSTMTKTSDLKWTSVGWEEVSAFDPEQFQTVRTYQVCKSTKPDQDNWIRSTFIPASKGQRLHVEITFSITKCDDPILKDAKYCRETFNLFYYESDKDVASSTFPPWRENPYKKVDTVAANTDGPVSIKTFAIGPLKRNGLYLAMQDQGACMSLNGLRVYYYYCPEITKQLATFPMTNAGGEATSLVPLKGECVSNAQRNNGEVPTYYCNSDGKWKILTGRCNCNPGYKRNEDFTLCQPCAPGSFKMDAGNQDCTACPANSGPGVPSNSSTASPSSGLDYCRCLTGYFRAIGEKKTEPCTHPPSEPRNVEISTNSTGVSLQWIAPKETGGREDISYRVTCQECPNRKYTSCTSCPSTVFIQTPDRTSTGGVSTVGGLKPFTSYIFKILAKNGVSSLSKESPKFATKKILTPEAVPSAVTSIFVTKSDLSSIEIKWRPPQEPNGIIKKYEIEIFKSSDSSEKSRITPPGLKETLSTSAVIDNLEPSTKYVIRIRAANSAGFGPYSESFEFQTMQASVSSPTTSTNSTSTIVIIVIVIAVLLVVVILGLVYYRRRISGQGDKDVDAENGDVPHEQESLMVNLPPPGERIYVEYSDPNQAVKNLNRELDPNDLTVSDKLIGEGEFAQVLHGNLSRGGTAYRVAVKQLKIGASVKDQSNFLREACSMAQFDHPNILQLKGVITKSRPCMIVSEYMEHGSLDEFLRARRQEIVYYQLIGMLRGIASGMDYLSKVKYVHRDLAARNILVNSDLICKVSDFGLSRTLENDPHATYTTQGGKIAIRWAAPECIRYREFTSASDVWSYGIVMWEVMSYGEKPYWDMTNQEVIENIEGGMRLPAPTGCSEPLHDKMVECWSKDPNKRPKFNELVDDLGNMKNLPIVHGSLPANASSSTLAGACATPNLQNALDQGEIATVEDWLHCQKLDKYKNRFLTHGLDTLDKVSNLTIHDLRSLGIDVTLHVHKLENSIRSLRRHLSTSSSRPASAYSADDPEAGEDDVMLPSQHETPIRPSRNGSVRRPSTIDENEGLVSESGVTV